MTAALVLAVAMAGPKVVELPEPSSGQVVVQAIVKAPTPMSDREQAAWDVLAEVLMDGTSDFSRSALITYGAQAGVPLKAEAWPDFMSVRIVEPAGGLSVGAQVMEALCYRASLTAEATADAVRSLRARRLDGWSCALLNLDPPYDRVTVEQVRNLYAVAFRPENTTLVFGGEIVEGEGVKEGERRFIAKGPAPSRLRFDRPARPRITTNDRVSTFELAGEPFPTASVAGRAKILASFALGVGKEASLFRVVRQQMRLSYRQEVVVWPSQRGWTPRFVYARTAADARPETLGEVREALIKDVATWDESSLVRAKAMATGSFGRLASVNPFWIGLDDRMGTSLVDRCAWAGLNAMMGSPVDPPDFESVTLEELKAAATDMLEKAQGAYIPGS